jgi:hypothetical protein
MVNVGVNWTLPPTACCMGRMELSQEQLSRWVVCDEHIFSNDLITYQMIVEIMLAASGACGQCSCQLGSPDGN